MMLAASTNYQQYSRCWHTPPKHASVCYWANLFSFLELTIACHHALSGATLHAHARVPDTMYHTSLHCTTSQSVWDRVRYAEVLTVRCQTRSPFASHMVRCCNVHQDGKTTSMHACCLQGRARACHDNCNNVRAPGSKQHTNAVARW